MKPILEILPPAQRKLWPLLHQVPGDFILYGGTAIALQIGHRESVDFDFFSDKPLDKNVLVSSMPLLKDIELVQPEMNTLNCHITLPEGVVRLQFLANLGQRQGRVEAPLRCDDNKILIAHLRDLFATKLNTIQLRAETKDYIDIDALIQHGHDLADGLGCARAIYGKNFDPGTSIRALCSFKDGDLNELPKLIQKRLIKSVMSVKDIPDIKPAI